MILQLHSLRQKMLAVAIFGFSASVFAAPSVNSVSGEFTNGGTITIQGSGFSNADAVTVLYDTVDNQSVYSALSDGAAISEDNSPWTHTNVYGTPISITRSGDMRSSDSSAVYYGETKSYLGWPAALENQQNRKIYMSWWFKPNQRADSGGSNKFARVWDLSDGTGTRISWTQMHMTFNDVNDTSPNWATTQPNANEWNHLEMYVDADSGLIRTWLNGERKHNVTTFEKASNSSGLSVGLVGFDPSIASNYGNLNFRMTDIYVSKSQARVEISDSPTWDPTSHRELLKINSWDSGEIQAEMNLLGFDSFANLYIYVVDENGDANQSGFPVCEKCPSEPESLTVE
ncbi:hypothetical protein [Marinobacter sp. JSM 1782161]|uniref:hypothetical protein n=1 Tax=Marinobacter sp. JSM 1782161 TaxID=2685906 RepID=UPI0014033396|nr:hypothetical protein [Marinobacter sp. JSM 1782161]